MSSTNVQFNLIDKSVTVGSPTGFIAGIVLPAPKGEAFKKVLRTADSLWIDTYGSPNPAYSLSAYSALSFYQYSNFLYTVRITKDAAIAYCLIAHGEGTHTTPVTGLAEDEEGVEEPVLGTNLFAVLSRFSTSDVNGMTITIGDNTSDTFTLTLKMSTGQVVESHIVSRKRITDDRGRSLYIEDVINNYSENIKVIDNTTIVETTMPKIGSIALGGGDSGAAPSELTVLDYEKGLKILFDSNGESEFSIKAVLDAGFATPDYAAVLAEYAAKHKSMAICTFPWTAENKVSPASAREAMITYADSVDALITDYEEKRHYCLNGTAVQIRDRYHGYEPIYIPCDGVVAGIHARAYGVNPHTAPAGVDYGRVEILRPLHSFKKEERDLLFDKHINYFNPVKGRGVFLWEQKNGFRSISSLSRISAVRLTDYMDDVLTEAFLIYTHRDITWDTLSDMVATADKVMSRLQASGGIYDYTIVADSTNNPPEQIELYRARVDIYFKITPKAEQISINGVVTAYSANFSEVRLGASF